MNELVVIGKVKSAKGLEGYLKVFCDIDLSNLNDKIVLRRGIMKDLFSIEESFHENNSNYLLKLKEIENIEKAKQFINADIMILDKKLKEFSKKAVVSEIIGMRIIDKKLGFLGEINQVIKSPANDIFSFIYNEKEILIPNVEKFVLSINRDEKVIETDLGEVEQFES